MQDLLNNFGINGFLLTAQLVNFLIIIYLLKRFAFGPILKLLNDRKKTIAESIKNAQETKDLLLKTEEKEKEILKKAQNQAQQIIADAKIQSSGILENADLSAKKNAERLLEDARKMIEDQTKESEKRLASYVTRLSIEMLEKSLKLFFTQDEQRKALERASKKLKV